MIPEITTTNAANHSLTLNPRRGTYYNIVDELQSDQDLLTKNEELFFERIDLLYRTLCSILYNFGPTSGHPGGSISSGRIVESLIFNFMDYDFSEPDRKDADIISYAAGHKAMGLYAMWALRNELVRVGAASLGINDLLPHQYRQLRLEDLLGFRRNPTTTTPLFKKFNSKALDGHPTCAMPFIRIATGASGVGIPASLGLALGGLDIYRHSPPKIHVLEGEGGMTPGRVHEALASASASQLFNVFLHIDWNQASIDSNNVCGEQGQPGDYVQWNPSELCYLHDWNVVFIPDGFDFKQIVAAQQLALKLENKQPTTLVYRTTKGWQYGINGKDSHGAGHKFCSDGYYNSLKDFENAFNVSFPLLEGEQTPQHVEENYYDSLMVIRSVAENNIDFCQMAVRKITDSRERLNHHNRVIHKDAPNLTELYLRDDINEQRVPEELRFSTGTSVTLRETLGKSLGILNQKTHGAFMAAAADLLGSTSVSHINKGFPEGFYNTVANPYSRLVSVGGICEDAMGALMAGLSSFGFHIGVTSSYSAFIAALEHVAARLHGIGQQAKELATGEPYNTWIMVNAHAGVKTGEDGPTHADPQALQLLQECFPDNVLITLTPWDPQEIWPLLIAGLKRRPAILAPFVTRPPEKIIDREKMGLPPAHLASQGMYAIRQADPSSKQYHGTIILQGNGVTSIFVSDVLPRIDEMGLNMNIYYITSVELFRSLPVKQQETIFPETLTLDAMGITDFTLPTLHQWIRSNEGLRRSLHSFRGGRYLGSGSASKVLEEAGLHAEGQMQSIIAYAHDTELRHARSKTMRHKKQHEVY